MILTSEVKRLLPELRALCVRAMDEAEAYCEAVKGAAKKCGVEPSALSAYVKALATDKLEQHETRTAQMSPLIDLDTETPAPAYDQGPEEEEHEEEQAEDDEPFDASVYERAGVALVVGDD